MQKGKIRKNLIRGDSTYTPPLPGVPLLELAGSNRVMIENHLGIVAYSDLKICVRTQKCTYTVLGSGLTVTYMSRCQMVICGRIDTIHLERG